MENERENDDQMQVSCRLCMEGEPEETRKEREYAVHDMVMRCVKVESIIAFRQINIGVVH